MNKIWNCKYVCDWQSLAALPPEFTVSIINKVVNNKNNTQIMSFKRLALNTQQYKLNINKHFFLHFFKTTVLSLWFTIYSVYGTVYRKH